MEDSSVKGAKEKRFQVLINVIMIILTLLAVLPFILLLGSSLTENTTLAKFGYNFWPRKFSAYAYQYLFSSNASRIFRAYGITVLVTVIGTTISLLVGPLLAYPLSRRDYKRARVITFLVFFTMLFNGGIVPSYIMWTQTFHIKNTIWSLIFPTLLFNGFYAVGIAVPHETGHSDGRLFLHTGAKLAFPFGNDNRRQAVSQHVGGGAGHIHEFIDA